jgi:2-amino-4-hydroxy-6-hydroxymethyldihydropteridine diphosphokinase
LVTDRLDFSWESVKRMATAYLALGSNLGDREGTLKGAREELNGTQGIRVAAFSPLYQTEPVGGPAGQGPYLNAVLQVETVLSPRGLLQRCFAVEALFGRQRRKVWGPRTLDVDQLFYGEEIRHDPDLVLPHPRLHLRRFVLAPMLDLAPELVHPLLGQTVRQLFASLQTTKSVRRFSETW